MNILPLCVVHTQAADLVRQLRGYLGASVALQQVEDARRIETVLEQHDPVLLLFDLRSEGSMRLLQRIRRNLPGCLVIALGEADSEPLLEAEELDLYAAVSVPPDRQRLKQLVARALDHLRLLHENRLLREAAADPADDASARSSRSFGAASGGHALARPPPPAAGAPHAAGGSVPLHHFSRAFRQFDRVDAMLESVVDGVANCVRVARVGIFAYDRDRRRYLLKAGINCLEDVRRIEVQEDDPLVRWLQLHAHLISAHYLGHLQNPSERLLLAHSLDTLGAEVILPLLGRERLLGWLFVGHRVTGLPFGEAGLEELMVYADHIAISLENALLYEEVAVQKTLAETVLHSIPVGIVAVGADGAVRWLNRAAEDILALRRDAVLGQPMRRLGIRMADLLATCARNEGQDGPVEWIDTMTKRSISVVGRRLAHGNTELGAVAMVHDITRERMLLDRQHQLERASFWTELAAAMSHEVRNPLVAVSTFAQLLPERYGDAEFREEFSRLVSLEIDRLNEMIDQIDSFANPPKLMSRVLNVETLIRKAIRRAESKGPRIAALRIVPPPPNGALKVTGDEASLVDCLTHLLVNAMEASESVAEPVVQISASMAGADTTGDNVVIRITDNGRGIAQDIREKLYSPFCTTKARGIGLGLPIARRTIADHNGELSIESAQHDTRVTVVLPRAG